MALTSPETAVTMPNTNSAVVLHSSDAARIDQGHDEPCPSPLPNSSSKNISLSISVSLLEQREVEMRQTASRLAIPKERWNGSLVYLQWEKQIENGRDPALTVVDGDTRMVSIALCPEALNEETTSLEWNRSAPSTLTWMQALLTQFYTTGAVSIPIAARGHEVVSLLDWLQIVYAPDQCQFADFAVYQRVRQWSRYLCHRSAMATHIVCAVEAAESNTDLAFATVDVEATTQIDHTLRTTLIDGIETVVSVLGEENDVSTVKHHSSLTKMASKLFNAAGAIDSEIVSEINDEVTLHGPEESTAAEMRLDFAAHVAHCLATLHPSVHTVTFSIRSVTTSENDAEEGVSVHRAVLLVTRSPNGTTENAPPPVQLQPRAVSCTSSELDVPVDELMEEEVLLATATLLQKGESRTVSFKDTSMDDSLNTTAPNTPQSTGSSDREQLESSAKAMASCSGYVNFADQIKAASDSTTSGQSLSRRASSGPHDDDYNAPHDELNASFELYPSIERKASVDTGIVSTRSSLEAANAPKKKRKPKPVFELPEKLLSEESFVQRLAPPMPLFKQPFAESTRLLNDNSLLPAPITIVRTGTYDNTVTSALTGPFYIDDNGNLRDVFEHSPDAEMNGSDDEDDDTRAQARRHEWIQTALLNRGIGERMETLLKEEPEETTPTLTSIDPWEWLTGLGVCEFSRTFVKSVEDYAREIGVDLRRDPDQTTPVTPENVETKGNNEMSIALAPNSFANTSSDELALGKTHPVNVSVEYLPVDERTVQNHLQIVQCDEQEMEDSGPQCDCNIEIVDQNDSMDESSTSQGSKDSPRGVQTFDTVMPDTVKLASSTILVKCQEATSGDLTAVTTLEQVVPKRKNRGIKSLFRRRKVDV